MSGLWGVGYQTLGLVNARQALCQTSYNHSPPGKIQQGLYSKAWGSQRVLLAMSGITFIRLWNQAEQG